MPPIPEVKGNNNNNKEKINKQDVNYVNTPKKCGCKLHFKCILRKEFSPSSTATLSRLRLMFMGATIVHVLVLGSYLSTELSEL